MEVVASVVEEVMCRHSQRLYGLWLRSYSLRKGAVFGERTVPGRRCLAHQYGTAEDAAHSIEALLYLRQHICPNDIVREVKLTILKR